jgi:Tol biopolymer transport system component
MRRLGILAVPILWSLAGAPPATALSEPAKALIAFNVESRIHTITADGSARALVASDAFDPAWSPDGRSIAYSRLLSTEDAERAQIWVTAADGSGARPVSREPREGWVDSEPSWAPDGQRIAFIRERPGGKGTLSTLISAAATGGDERRIAEITSEFDTSFETVAWSPDGSRFLVTQTATFGDISGEHPSLYLVDVATGRRGRLLRNAGEGSWSPDGTRIAYRGFRRCELDHCDEVYTANADGGGRRRLTYNDAIDTQPSWSADGQRIAFASSRNYPESESMEIYSMAPDGSCLTWLTNGTRSSFDPAWQPGAGLRTDPTGCGAVPREPLIETDTSEVASTFPVWWLGTRFGNLLLSSVDTELGFPDLDYRDCSQFDPAECPAPITISNLPVCLGSVLSEGHGRNVSRYEGALIHTPPHETEDTPQMFIGATWVGLGLAATEGPPPRAVLDGLRRFGDDAPPAGGLPRAQLPLRFWRNLERVRAAFRKYGSAAAAGRRLGFSRRRVRNILSLDKRLRQIGPFGRLDCRR